MTRGLVHPRFRFGILERMAKAAQVDGSLTPYDSNFLFNVTAPTLRLCIKTQCGSQAGGDILLPGGSGVDGGSALRSLVLEHQAVFA